MTEHNPTPPWPIDDDEPKRSSPQVAFELTEVPNPLALPSMIIGIVAVTIALIPVLGFIAPPIAVLAVVFGAIALYKCHNDGAAKRGQAITGLATGGAALVIWLLWFVFWAMI